MKQSSMQAHRAGSRLFSSKPHRILRLDGDGVGPEIVSSAVRVLAATGVPIEWTQMNIGFEHAQKTGGPSIGEEHLKAFEEIGVCFKGPLTVPSGNASFVTVRGRTFTSANQVFRKTYNLYANIRPAKSVAGVPTFFPKTDLVIVRENTEDLYCGEEKFVNPDTAEGIKRITRGASTRIAQTAWDYAIKNGRKRITAVHKANVCKKTDGLFLEACRAVADKYKDSGIKYDEQLCDSLLTKMVQTPEEYEVLLCPNLFGDLVSDLAAGLIGSLGLMPSGQFGEKLAVFEPAHGSAPDIAGKGIVNPTSQVRTAGMMLEFLGEHEAARKVDAAVVAVINEKKHVTQDLGGKATTTQMTDAIVEKMKSAKL